MRSLLIKDGDLVIDRLGNFVMVDGKEEEGQSIERALSTNKDEWYLNIVHGLEYSILFARPFDEDRARLAITETIYQDDRVDKVDDIRFLRDRPNRKMEIFIRATMKSGNVIEEVIPIE